MQKFKWTREPKCFEILDNSVTITTDPHTDLWQKTYYRFCNDNAPVFQIETEEKYFYLSGWNDFSKNKKRACNVGTPPPR